MEEVALLSNVISQTMVHMVVVVVGLAGGVEEVAAIMVGGDAQRILDEVVEHPL